MKNLSLALLYDIRSAWTAEERKIRKQRAREIQTFLTMVIASSAEASRSPSNNSRKLIT